MNVIASGLEAVFHRKGSQNTSGLILCSSVIPTLWGTIQDTFLCPQGCNPIPKLEFKPEGRGWVSNEVDTSTARKPIAKQNKTLY